MRKDNRTRKNTTMRYLLKTAVGEGLVYLVSDDNFSAEQWTLLMMFELLE